MSRPVSPLSMPEAPPLLVQRIEEAIAAVSDGASLATASSETLLRAAEGLFERSLRGGCTQRGSAVALLVVDALVTYAFERASADPTRIEDRAAQAMMVLARLSVPGGTPATE